MLIQSSGHAGFRWLLKKAKRLVDRIAQIHRGGGAASQARRGDETGINTPIVGAYRAGCQFDLNSAGHHPVTRGDIKVDEWGRVGVTEDWRRMLLESVGHSNPLSHMEAIGWNT